MSDGNEDDVKKEPEASGAVPPQEVPAASDAPTPDAPVSAADVPSADTPSADTPSEVPVESKATDMPEEVLSKDEIDALLEGVSSGGIDLEEDASKKEKLGSIEVYDFASQNSIVRSRIPAINGINEEFAKSLRESIINMLRRNTSVDPKETTLVAFSDFIHGVKVPCSLHLVYFRPLRGVGLVVFSPDLIFRAVENFFGGNSKTAPNFVGRQLGPTEIRVSHLIMNLVVECLQSSWEMVLPIRVEHGSSETNPLLVNIVNPSDLVLVNTFNVDIEGGDGYVSLCMPYTMLEPVRQHLEQNSLRDKQELDEHWSRAFRENIFDSMADATARLTNIDVSISDVLSFQPGDVLYLDDHDTAMLCVEKVPMFTATYGAQGHHLALKVMDPIPTRIASNE